MARDKKIKSKKVVLASDHAGFKLKEEIKKFLIKKKEKVLDLGTENTSSVDYPDYAHLLSKKMRKDKNQFGILICGSGTGMSMAANKHKNIRAALCYDTKSTKLSRLHNNANVMTIGAKLTKKNVALKCVNTFLKTDFNGGRHSRRVKKILNNPDIRSLDDNMNFGIYKSDLKNTKIIKDKIKKISKIISELKKFKNG